MPPSSIIGPRLVSVLAALVIAASGMVTATAPATAAGAPTSDQSTVSTDCVAGG